MDQQDPAPIRRPIPPPPRRPSRPSVATPPATSVAPAPADPRGPHPAALPPAPDPAPIPPARSAPAVVDSPRTSRSVVVLVVAGTLLGVLGGTAGGYLAGRHTGPAPMSPSVTTAPEDQADVGRPPAALGPGTRCGPDIAAVAAATAPSVVQVNVVAGQEGGTGSGFVIDRSGHIVTNAHVATAGGSTDTDITVVLPDGQEVPADLVGISSDYDLAVLRVQAADPAPLDWADSAKVRVGQTVVALGSPLGLQGTVTTGIVSALDRPVTAGDSEDISFISAIQTDAAINPGNSGGPLVDTDCRVVGVNSAIAALDTAGQGQSGSIGLGFAIPAATASRVVGELIATGKASTPWIGVSLEDGTKPGALVSEVAPSSPASQAGLRDGDLITAIDGAPVRDSTDMVVALREHPVGDDVDLRIDRDGQTMTVTVTPAARR